MGTSAMFTRCEFHPNGKALLSGDLLGSIREWDLASGRAIGSFDAKALHTYEAGQQVDFGGVRGLAVIAGWRARSRAEGCTKPRTPSGPSTSRSC